MREIVTILLILLVSKATAFTQVFSSFPFLKSSLIDRGLELKAELHDAIGNAQNDYLEFELTETFRYDDEHGCKDAQIPDILLAVVGLVGPNQYQGALIRNYDENDNDYVIQATVNYNRSESQEVNTDFLIAVFHKLFLQFLEMEDEIESATFSSTNQFENKIENEMGRSVARIRFASPSFENVDSAKVSTFLQNAGIILGTEAASTGIRDDLEGIDLSKFTPFLHRYAFHHRGTDQGRTALNIIEKLSSRRVPFNFRDHKKNCPTINDNIRNGRNVISHEENVLPSRVVKEVMEVMDVIKERQWLSTNPDSVDGLPSLHLNLITDGSPLFAQESVPLQSIVQSDNVTFEDCIVKMTSLLKPHLNDKLLTRVRQLTNSSTVEISDVFIRSYGALELGSSNDETHVSSTRYGLSSHYDITSFATCVMALDESASSGKSGLFTIPTSSVGEVSNHSALRKFFSLSKGDGVVHSYDVLHGVDVDPRLNTSRTSLVVWFIDNDNENNNMETETTENVVEVNQPWLLHTGPGDDIGQFILALASESGFESDGGEMKLKNVCDQFDLNVSSASKGNAFALTRLGQLCDDDMLSNDYYLRIDSFLRKLNPHNPFLPKKIGEHGNAKISNGEGTFECKKLAKALWYDASMKGNRISQVSLADELMLEYMTAASSDDEPYCQVDMLLMASTLFKLALNQGYRSAEDSLRRLMDVESRRLASLGVEIPSDEFFDYPVVQTILT